MRDKEVEDDFTYFHLNMRKGGNIILDTCRKVLDLEFPQFKELDLCLPDESNRRVGQSIAAASLPASNK